MLEKLIKFHREHEYITIAILVVSFFAFLIEVVPARDLGQWENTDPETRAWFKSLRMPDNPTSSCCGEADSYYCSEHATKEGQVYCIIDDDRDNEALSRTPIKNGTVIAIPPEKLNKDSNPTGRAIVFLSSNGSFVYCFISAGSS